MHLQIHVVQRNQTVTSIAQAYSVPVNRLSEANQLENPDRLVVGQALVIPIVGSYYFVQPGDSLSTISQKVGIPVSELVRINQLSVNQSLPVGFRLYIPAKPKRTAEFNGYVEIPPGNDS